MNILSFERHGQKKNIQRFLLTVIIILFIFIGQACASKPYLTKNVKWRFVTTKMMDDPHSKYRVYLGLHETWLYEDLGTRKVGVFDDASSERRFVTKAKYNQISRFTSSKTARVCINDKNGKPRYGLIDNTGKELVSCIYQNLDAELVDNTFRFAVDGKDYPVWGIMNRSGEVIVEPKYFFISEFRKSIATYSITTSEGERFGIINTSGKIIVPPTYAWMGLPYNTGADDSDPKGAPAKTTDGKWGFVDYNGIFTLLEDATAIIQPEAASEKTFLVPAQKANDKWGFASAYSGTWRVEPIYDAIWPVTIKTFNANLFVAESKGKLYVLPLFTGKPEADSLSLKKIFTPPPSIQTVKTLPAVGQTEDGSYVQIDPTGIMLSEYGILTNGSQELSTDIFKKGSLDLNENEFVKRFDAFYATLALYEPSAYERRGDAYLSIATRVSATLFNTPEIEGRINSDIGEKAAESFELAIENEGDTVTRRLGIARSLKYIYDEQYVGLMRSTTQYGADKIINTANKIGAAYEAAKMYDPTNKTILDEYGSFTRNEARRRNWTEKIIEQHNMESRARWAEWSRKQAENNAKNHAATEPSTNPYDKYRTMKPAYTPTSSYSDYQKRMEDAKNQANVDAQRPRWTGQ